MSGQDRTHEPLSGRQGLEDEMGRYAEAILRTMRQPLLVLSGEFRVEMANSAFYRTFAISEAEVRGRLLYELGNGQWNIPELRELLENILPNKGTVEGLKVDQSRL